MRWHRHRLHWVHRGDLAPGGSELLAAALEGVDLPGSAAGDGRAYLLGESRAVVTLRSVLAGRGLSPERMYVKGYWNRAPVRAGGRPAQDEDSAAGEGTG